MKAEKATAPKTESSFAKYRRCSRWAVAVCLVALLLLCCQLLLLAHMEQLGLDRWYGLYQTLSVLVMIASGIGLVFILLMLRYAKCPHCGKSVLSKWWNYGGAKRIGKRQPLICPHCGEEVETA